MLDGRGYGMRHMAVTSVASCVQLAERHMCPLKRLETKIWDVAHFADHMWRTAGCTQLGTLVTAICRTWALVD